MLTTEDAAWTREQGETAERVAEDMADTLRAGIECLQTRARTLQDAVESSADAVSALSRRSPGQVMSGYGLADREAQGLIEEASRNLRAVAQPTQPWPGLFRMSPASGCVRASGGC